MIHDPLSTPPAHASPPDPDRDGTTASAAMPEWVVHLIALVIRFLLERALAARSRCGLPAWWNHRPDLAPGSAQQYAAWRRGAFGNAIAWTCRRRGIGPGHKNWPEIARAIVAYGGSIAGFRPGLPACGLHWWENPDIVPGMTDETPATPAADALAALLAQPPATATPHPFAAQAANNNHAVPAPRPAIAACPVTAPPTGPPRSPAPLLCHHPAPAAARAVVPVHAAHNVTMS